MDEFFDRDEELNVNREMQESAESEPAAEISESRQAESLTEITESIQTEPAAEISESRQAEPLTEVTQSAEPETVITEVPDAKPAVEAMETAEAERQQEAAPEPGKAAPQEQSGSGGYYSAYDRYRFRTPYEDRRYGNAEPAAKENDRKDTAKKVGFVAALAAVFALVFALVFAGASALLRGGNGSSGGSPEVQQEEPEEHLIIGNQDSASESGSGSVQGHEEELSPEAPAIEDLQPEESADVPEGGAAAALSVPEVVSKVMPSMVSITNVTEQEYQNFFGEKQTYQGVSAGSGIIVGQTETAYLIATNNHVIEDSSDITVTFADETTAPGTVKGADADYDLAIVAVKMEELSDETKEAIRIVNIGDSDTLQVGEPVIAIGNALGYGQSVSQGIVSALGRQMTDTDGTIRTMIQTDASINPGNSGGALLNMRGELIGINEAKTVGTEIEGVGYAIPMAIAEPILIDLGSKTAREQVDSDHASYLGISCMTMPSTYTQSGYPAGAYVSEVVEGGPAAKAGIQEGDIITAMDGVSVASKEDLVGILSYYAAGEEITLSVSRINEKKDGFEKLRLSVTLGSRKEAGLTEDSKQGSGAEEGSAENEDADESDERAENGRPGEIRGGFSPFNDDGDDLDDFFGNDRGLFDFFG